MEVTIQQNGKVEQPLPLLTHESVEDKDQRKNGLEITGESNLLQQSSVLTSNGSPSSTRRTASSLHATTNTLKDLISTDEVVRLSLINDNWKIVESKKSRMVSTLPRYSTRSLVPPLLARHDRISDSQLSSTIISTSLSQVNAYHGQNMGQHNGNHAYRSSDTSFNYNGKSGEGGYNGKWGKGGIHGKSSEAGYNGKWGEGGFNGKSGEGDFHRESNARVKSNSVEREFLRNNRFGGRGGKQNNRHAMSFNNSFDDDDEVDEDDDADDLFNVTMRKKRNVPLPSFRDYDDDGAERSVSEEEEDGVPYTSQWSLKDKGSLSFYDNMMDLDIKKPLYMLVPDSLEGNSTPRVGELELDQLSELSENDSKSNEMPFSDADDDFSRYTNPRKLLRVDSAVQTDEPDSASRMKEAGTMTAADIIAEIEAERSGKNRPLRSFIPLPTRSTEGGEVDPKFTKRPATYVEVLEGEAISITCQLNGSAPIDVFWFRDVEDVTQLEEDKRCDIDHVGDTFTLTLFDTTKKDSGQYLCIGVNTHGHCVQGFQVNIKENKNQGIPPSFLVGMVNIEAFKEEKATFACKVVGYPPPRVLWYRKGDRCKDGRKYQIANDGNGGHKLIVRDVDETDALYSAIARNVNGEVSSKSEVRIKERDVENTKTTASVSSVTSPYPDVDELVQIAQKVSSTHSEITPSRTTSRTFSFTHDRAFDESTLKREKDQIRKEQTPRFKAYSETDEVFSPLPKTKKDPNDDEQELNVSYQEFERLFEAQLISRSQLHSGRVWKKDLEKIQAFLKQSPADNKKPQKIEADDGDTPLLVNCGLKSVDPNFYRRDYVVNMDSAKRNLNSESNHRETQQTTNKILRSNSMIPSSTAKSVKVVSTSLDNLSSQEKHGNLSRSEIVNAMKLPSGGVVLNRSNSVDVNSLPRELVSMSTNIDHDSSSADEKYVMPCVKELLSKFAAPMSPETPADDVSPLKRIYSLTGRSIPEFVRNRLQSQLSSGSTTAADKRIKENTTSESYNSFSLPSQHSTYVDGAPLVITNTDRHGVKTETVTKGQISYSASSNITHENVDVRGFSPGQLQKSRIPSGRISRSVDIPALGLEHRELDGAPRGEDTVVRRRAVYWMKYISEQHKPEKFPKMPYESHSSGDD